jgi:pyrroline-5-carboxylate reductase
MTNKILMVGCGKMGFALLQSFVNGGIPAESLYVIEPDGDFKKNHSDIISKINYFPDIKAMHRVVDDKKMFALVIIAVKPQVFEQAANTFRYYDDGKTVFLSIAAGKRIETIQALFSPKTPIIRAMPNLPAFVGQGLTALMPNQFVGVDQFQYAEHVFEMAGDVIRLDSEQDFDAVTAISGSGPAYVFHLIECLVNAAKQQDLPPKIIETLVRKTVLGSALMAYESKEQASTLRQNVTSKAGTTEAALNVLMKDDAMQNLFEEAIEAATIRSKQLNS